jgi:hypothetical protein
MDNSMNNFYSMSLATLVGVTHITTSNTTIIKTDTVYFTDPNDILKSNKKAIRFGRWLSIIN